MASTNDIKIASLAAGFTIGFGFLTVWEAIKQTRRNRWPLRSAYIWMIWGEIVANGIIGILAWLFLDGVIGVSVPLLFSLLFLWVFEIQLLMQIIINRILIIAEPSWVIRNLKWGTAAIITAINIAVFVIWIPAHTVPPVNETFVAINKYWDRTSKVLILIVDAGLNWYFLHTVKKRLVQEHGLLKYQPLVSFNAKLMVLSVAMDALLIGLMSLPNEVVYVQFHPVAYMVKLNIEMSMASLIARLARLNPSNDVQHYPHSNPTVRSRFDAELDALGRTGPTKGLDEHDMSASKQGVHSSVSASVKKGAEDGDGGRKHVGIHRTMEMEMTVERSSTSSTLGESGREFKGVEDEAPLTRRPGTNAATTIARNQTLDMFDHQDQSSTGFRRS